MRILFILAVLSCCALVWAAISIARHVKKNHAAKETAGDGFAETLLRTDYQDPTAGGRRTRLHPREDMAVGRVAGRRPQPIAKPVTDNPSIDLPEPDVRNLGISDRRTSH